MYTAGNKLGVTLSTFVLIGMDQADLKLSSEVFDAM